MPFGQLLLLKVPTLLLAPLVIGGGIALSVAGLLIVRHFVPHHKLKAHHDVADPILGALGAMYAVLLAFAVVTIWQAFEKCDANVDQEANYLADLYRDAEAFSPDFQAKISVLLREYRQAVVNDEWKTMQRGQMSPEVERLMRKIWALYTTYQPRNSTEQSFFDESVRKLNSFRELRRQRLMDSRTGANQLLWLMLIIGAVVTVSFTFLFGAENVKAQIIMVVLLAGIISLSLFAILEMDFPFTGTVSIPSDSFKGLLLD